MSSARPANRPSDPNIGGVPAASTGVGASIASRGRRSMCSSDAALPLVDGRALVVGLVVVVAEEEIAKLPGCTFGNSARC